jgi:hypothetical protein
VCADPGCAAAAQVVPIISVFSLQAQIAVARRMHRGDVVGSRFTLASTW